MNYSYALSALALVFFALVMGAIRVGQYVRRSDGSSERNKIGSSAIEGTVFALLGLLIAFSFSGAAQRMSDRRSLLVEEVNAIGTAWLRIDLLNADDQPALRDQFRRYVDKRIDYYRHVADLTQRDAIANEVATLQKEIWIGSMSAAKNSTPPFAASYVSSVNSMFDVSTSLTAAQKVHPPILMYAFLGFLTLVCATLVGLNLGESKRDAVFHPVLYALVMTAALYIIIDFEFPRIGTIRIDGGDALLLMQREAMLP